MATTMMMMLHSQYNMKNKNKMEMYVFIIYAAAFIYHMLIMYIRKK